MSQRDLEGEIVADDTGAGEGLQLAKRVVREDAGLVRDVEDADAPRSLQRVEVANDAESGG